jgi:hypothetical protein
MFVFAMIHKTVCLLVYNVFTKINIFSIIKIVLANCVQIIVKNLQVVVVVTVRKATKIILLIQNRVV